MTVAYADLISAFPEFSNSTTFPQSQVNFWLAQAYNALNTVALQNQADLAVMLYVAHNITMSARNVAAFGVAMGQTTGPVSSKSVGSASVSYDVGATTIDRAGPWNATTYGMQLYKLLQTYSYGGVYVQGDAFARARVNPWPGGGWQ